MEKTYRDFYNEVINEAVNKAEGLGSAHKKLKESLKNPKEDQINYKELLKTYAEAFIIQHEKYFEFFINAIVKSSKSTPVMITKYQFIQAFFMYYFERVFRKNFKLVNRCLNKASESLELDKIDYSNYIIKKIYKMIKDGQKNKKLLVSIFDSLMGGY